MRRTVPRITSKSGSHLQKIQTEYPFEYKFIDEEYSRKFKAEERTGTTAALFRRADHFHLLHRTCSVSQPIWPRTASRRSVSGKCWALPYPVSRPVIERLLKLVMISFVIASPVARWMMDKWLQDYPYHVNIHWYVFAIAGLLSS